MLVPHRTSRRRNTTAAVLAALLLPLLQGTAAAEGGPVTGDTVVGALVQAWPEYEDPAAAAEHGSDQPLSWIEPEDGDAVRVVTDDVQGLEVGTTVEVALGDEVSDTASGHGMEPARQVEAIEQVGPAPDDPALAEALPVEQTTNSVTVVMVVPAGGTRDSTTLADVVALVDGAVSTFWWTESYQTIGIRVTAQHDWPAVPYTASCADPTALWNEAAATSGFVAGPGKHLMLYLPKTSTDCAYGLAEIGRGPTSGGRLYVRDTATSVIAHELGHNFGLGHSSAQQCDGTIESPSCRIVGYRDYYDVMGGSWEENGSLNPPQAAWLGVIPESARTVIPEGASASTVVLPSYGARASSRAIKLLGADGTVHWLEYRTPQGQDAWLGDQARNWIGLQSGVLVRREPSSTERTYTHDGSYLLDGTPSSSTGWDADLGVALPVGQEVRLGAGFVVTVDRADATEAAVTVRPVDTLASGQTLASKWSLTSKERGYRATQQSDGNLVVSAPDGRVLWASYGYAKNGRTVLHADGNLATYASDGQVVWRSGTSSPAGARLVMQDDGNLVLYRADGTPAWWTGMDTPHMLRAGQFLTGQQLTSPSGQYRAVSQSDGNLVVYGPAGRVVWANYRYAAGGQLRMQADGNVVSYARDGRAVWHTNTWGNPGARLTVQDDGNLVVYRANGTPAWWSGPDTPATLRTGQSLTRDQALHAPGGRYRAVAQTDGNLVVYGPAGRVVWASHRFSRDARLAMQADGNLVSYAPDGRAIWHTDTWGNPHARLTMQDDGNLVVYRSDGSPAWWTGADPWR